ncbi:MAG: hypothetical protein ABIJ09_01695 [Pseudomonadota bacterium]
MKTIWRTWGHLAARRRACMLALALSSLAVSAAALIPYGVPVPSVHDEYGLLFGAQTLAQGRLSNPPHPLWQHFETIYVLSQPTYASAKPPGQSLAMALGITLTGQPIVGVWIASALMIAALYWMLLAWTSPRWALFGGLITLFCLGTWGDWTETYWGPSVAGLGSALLLGGLGWLRRRDRLRDGLLLGAGLAILANTRPYEGLAASLPVAIALVAWGVRLAPPVRVRRVLRATLPIALSVGLGLSFLLWSNLRITGSVFELPYSAYAKTYMARSMPLLDLLGVGGKSRPVEFRHDVFQKMANVNFVPTPQLHSAREIPYYIHRRLLDVWTGSVSYYFAPLGPVVLLLIPLLVRFRRLRLALASFGVGFVAQMMPPWHEIRHFSPFVAATLLLLVATVRLLASVQVTRRLARRGIPLLVALACLFVGAGRALEAGREPQLASRSWCHERQRIEQHLAASGRHLIIVHYPGGHSVHREWVYNAPDIDASAVVWARDMGAERNAELIAYFGDRQIWWLVPPPEYQGPPTLQPYHDRTEPMPESTLQK